MSTEESNEVEQLRQQIREAQQAIREAQQVEQAAREAAREARQVEQAAKEAAREDARRARQAIQAVWEAAREVQQAIQAAREAQQVEQAARMAVREEARKAQQAIQAARERSDHTTLPTFLELCHNQFFTPLRVKTNLPLTIKGSITSAPGKKHPTHLRPWLDFPELQQQYFDRAYRLLCPGDSSPRKLFSPPVAIEDLGRTLCRQPLGSEKDLEQYERFAVENKVERVLEELLKTPEAAYLLNECTEIAYENHLHSLSDNAEDVLERQKRSRTSLACVFRNTQGNRSLLFVREYKAAHKLTVDYLRAGLRPMNLHEEVVQRSTIPQDPGEKLNYTADRLVAAAVTQMFEYMIENGLEFSCIATGPAEVYLRVLEDDPTTAYYYLAEPKPDVGEVDELGFRYPFTAIARMLGFSLMALQSRVRDQAWRNKASQSLHHWEEDFDDILQSIPAEERRATPPASIYKRPAYPVYPRSPYLIRSQLLALSDDAGPTTSFVSESSSSDEYGGGSHLQASTMEPPSRVPNNRKRKRSATQGTSDRGTAKEYCTQKCLLGLKHERALDPACPNYRSHQRKSRSDLHELNIESFHQRVQAQLQADVDHHCEPLGKQGARGALFKISLTSHGYTFVGKGTIEVFIDDLRHEGRMYDLLESLQGLVVPVYLGNMDLHRTYYLDVGVRITHMLYMAFGGESLYHGVTSVSPATLRCEEERSRQEVARFVSHNDIRLDNML